jgi:hypothetical protein
LLNLHLQIFINFRVKNTFEPNMFKYVVKKFHQFHFLFFFKSLIFRSSLILKGMMHIWQGKRMSGKKKGYPFQRFNMQENSQFASKFEPWTFVNNGAYSNYFFENANYCAPLVIFLYIYIINLFRRLFKLCFHAT